MMLMVASDGQAAGLVFSELMYNPLPSSTNAADDDQFEFLELRNTTASPINLSGAYFSAGITFTFPSGTNLAAGAYGLLVRSVSSMTGRYGSLTNILGVYTGKLANEGEQVTLRKSDGTILFSVTYGDAFPWPEAADGHGASLVLADVNGDPDSPGSWSFSDAFQGTPGKAGGGWTPTVVINEILAHTDEPMKDSIELLNTSTQAVSVLGWYLSDDPVMRSKYRITNTAAISPGGFLVLTTNQFDSPSAATSNRFALSELGETLYLTSSNRVRFADYVKFGASENGVSLGRSPDGWGGFTFMATNTLGFSNGFARVGPVVISEIMYHPVSDNPNDEYVELLNITGTAVPLYDAARPTNTWRLASAVDYVFPTNVTMPAGGRVLVTGATNLTAFRATYSVPTTIPVYGAWTGVLDNAGESVRLYKPGNPETNGFVPQILVDRVDYLDSAPWPTAPDGNGPSLERLVVTNVANTASNWFVGAPGGSPGVAPAGGFFNPQVLPAMPVVLQAFTVTVAVVAQPLPTQVVCRTVIDGVTSNRVMRDTGVSGDAVTNDQVYTVVIAELTNAAWVYYAFDGYSTSGEVFSLPESEVEPVAAPALRVQLDLGSPGITVVPSLLWEAYSVTGLASHAQTFTIQLLAAGEALVDDVRLLDSGGTNHIVNGGFDAPLSTGWVLNANHGSSTIEALPSEGDNRVLHLKTPVAPSGWDNVGQTVVPPMVTGTPAVLSFRTRQTTRQLRHWFWVPVGAVAADVALNEVMYHPARTNEADHEYVELFKPGAAAVDVSGWELDGAGFTIPAGTWIGPTGYLVCAANTGVVAAAHGITNVTGNWTGTLQNNGETLTLKNAFGREVDRLTYDDREPWPSAADGYGPSLERINPAWTGNAFMNWAASSAGTNWVQVTLTNAVGANSRLAFYLGYDGKCRVDDVSVKAIGSAVELVSNGTFEAGMPGWSATNNHSQSRVVAGAGRGGGYALALVGNSSRWTPLWPPGEVIRFGDGVSNAVFSTTLATQAGTNYVVSWWVCREGLGESVYGVVGKATGEVSFAAWGSPGRVNSVVSGKSRFGLEQGPRLFDVGSPGSTNIIRARVIPAGAATNVYCRYRLVGSNTYQFSDAHYAAVVMKDDGVEPDSMASDGEFACWGPPVTSAWTLVRYHLLAEGTNGVMARIPAPDDPGVDDAYWVQGTAVQTNLPDWRLMVDGDPVEYPFVRRACAVSPNGQSFADITIRHRGRIEYGETAYRTGVAVRMHRGRLLNAWFANNQGGINFRNRIYNQYTDYYRTVNEWLAYDLQSMAGFPTPRTRHVCIWINGTPTVTMELEDPEEDFLKGNGIGLEDYVSRVGWTGRNTVGGDAALDNLEEVKALLDGAAGAGKVEAVRTNLWYESIQHCLALLSMTANADQFFVWNMFQHRSAGDGRWSQYPWDVDMSFQTRTVISGGNTNYLPHLHPYYQTPLHPGIWDTNPPPSAEAGLLGKLLFHPESGPGSDYTLPYRHRQQMTLWRYYHTLQSTNYLFPKLDDLRARLLPVFSQVGINPVDFTNRVAIVKQAILARREFLMNGNWSDKNVAIWNPTNVYVTTHVVINEIMSHAAPGGEYLELYNRGAYAVDMSHWLLTISNESYRLPFGTMLGPTSYLVVADTQMTLTNFFAELAPAMIQRYRATPLWDWPVVWTSATEYASRVVEIPQITLPDAGATITLRDLLSNVVDTVTYGAVAPWPTGTTASIELVDPAAGNDVGTAWQSSLLVGTPGWVNSVAADGDGDGLPDAWEQRVVDALGGDGITNVQGVATNGDFDGDGVLNDVEYVAGLDPTVDDADALSLSIRISNAVVVVEFGTTPPEGEAYWGFDARLYTLDEMTNLMAEGSWTNIPAFTDLVGGGQVVVYTNSGAGQKFYRYRVRLRERR